MSLQPLEISVGGDIVIGIPFSALRIGRRSVLHVSIHAPCRCYSHVCIVGDAFPGIAAVSGRGQDYYVGFFCFYSLCQGVIWQQDT